jgi:simple sugar transport system permease protein
MIGGEFDLSVGSTLGAAGMTIMLLTTHFGWSLWPAVAATLGLCIGIGFLNGYAVVRTGLPSFIVTLATLFIVRGLTIAAARGFTRRTQLGGLDQVPGYETARLLFGSDPVANFRVSLLWWIALTVLGTWFLLRSPYGSWVFAAGGHPEAARNAGVPVNRVKIGLFMTTALCAGLVAILQVVRFSGTDALRGQLQEFHAIIVVVMGGTLLTGGHGSVVGAAFGALVFGMVRQGIVMAGVDADWFQVFLGAMLLGAVLVNTYTLRKAREAR